MWWLIYTLKAFTFIRKNIYNNNYTKLYWEKFTTLKRFPDRKDSVSGAGIEFLPSSVDGLFEKLALLSGEYKAGNTTTRNELVAVK